MTTAFVFPGQGSQSIGMLADLATEYAIIEQTFAEASDALGYDLWQLVQAGPVEDLNQTHRTQPALLTASVAIYRAFLAQGGEQPSMMAGHSLGEYSALVCAGSLNFIDAVKLVALRGELMQQAVPEGTGAMAAIIGLDDDSIAQCCLDVAQDEIVSPVNFNSPGQVVIAGHKEAVARASAACKAAGAKRALPLPVSVPSHCELMKPAAEKLAEALEQIEIKVSEIPVINNVDVVHAANAAAVKDALVRQLFCPVRWAESVNVMAESGVTHLVECGPGKVLTGLTKRINKSLTAASLNAPADFS